jgi:hypothetical protein
MPEVNKEAIAEWVAALRSGRYKQAHEELGVRFDDNTMGFCCLGVACEVFADQLGLTRIAHGRHGQTYGYAWMDGKRDRSTITFGILPAPVADYLGFDNENPPLMRGFSSCTQMNDADQADFDAIADAIEAEYLLEDDDAD